MGIDLSHRADRYNVYAQEGDGSCDVLRKVFDFKSGMGQEEANEYKYVFDVGECLATLKSAGGSLDELIF